MKIQRIELERLPNCRDLKDFPATAGKKIKSHRLIRSGELAGATVADLQRLQEEYELRTVIDFRTAMEQHERPDPVMEGVRYISHPILNDETMGVTREEKADQDVVAMLMQQIHNPAFSAERYMAGLYQNLVRDSYSRGQYRKFFELLLAQESGATLWHCTAGKDRVGTGTALLLSALGVDRDLIVQDFMMTNVFLERTNQLKMEAVERQTGSREAAKQVGILFSVKESYLQALMDIIDREFDGMDAFLESEMGLTAERRQRLLDMYTV